MRSEKSPSTCLSAFLAFLSPGLLSSLAFRRRAISSRSFDVSSSGSGSPEAIRSSSSSIASTSSSSSPIRARSLSRCFSDDFLQVNEYLLAFASTLVPSRK